MKKQTLYYVYKITTSKIKDEDCNVSLTPSQARLDGELVSLGDNQAFHVIRNYYKKETDINRLNKLKRSRDELKKLESSKKNSEIIGNYQNKIDEILLVTDIVNVEVDNKKVYKNICKDGFFVNGIEYKRFSLGAGQARRNTASFINKEIYEDINKILLNGLDIKEINLSKFSAYYGLYMSGILKVRTPRVCLINDCELEIFDKKVDFIVDKIDSEGNEYRDIEERTMNLKMNVFDGQGLISPEFAREWADDLELKYLPGQFTIRAPYTKGMVSVFDFKLFAKEIAKTNKIKDIYGMEYNIDDIDIILSVSQFKTWKYYKSYQEYEYNCKVNNHIWGVAKYTAKKDNEYSLLNYQYLQTLDLNKDDLQKLAQPTIDWIEKICSGDKLYTLLFLLGSVSEDDGVNDILDGVGNDFIKAIIYNDKLLEDSYVKKKIYDSIERRITDAKIGRLWTKGNYQMMIADIYAQAEFAFRLPVKGLLNEFEHYSNFWNNRNINKVDACRSPMVDFHEHNILGLIDNDLVNKWYKYNYTGIIYNVWGTDTVRHSDADFDGDIVFTTDNQIMLDSIIPNLNVISYDKVSSPSEKFTYSNICKADLKSFDSKVGVITNFSTSFIAMLSEFKRDSNEYNELIKRIKLLRRYIGDSIDVAKGIKMKPFPKDWKKREKILDTDSDELKAEKYYQMKLVASKKPYFMQYIYDDLRVDYEKYRYAKNEECIYTFGKKIKDIIFDNEKNLTEEELKFKRKYRNHMPVINSSCAVNNLCRIIEHIDFKYKYPKSQNNQEIIDILLDKDIPRNKKTFNQVCLLYKDFEKHLLKITRYDKNILSEEDEQEKNRKLQEFYEEFRRRAELICSNDKELANYCVEVAYSKNKIKDFAWNLLKNGIMKNIHKNQDKQKYLPVYDIDGIEYLGNKYSLKEFE